MLRTHNCGQLRLENIDQQVVLIGWVNKIRKLSHMSFFDLRDRYGITQVISNFNSDSYNKLKNIKTETVLKITGKVSKRKSINKQILTGSIEIITDNIEILSSSKLSPFIVNQENNVHEDLKLKYRYLDLRKKTLLKNLKMRSELNYIIHNFFKNCDFINIETPILSLSTPEGARDFVVPSRIKPFFFYALPQSPQLFKQLLMIAGIDRYYQITRCFRDEDFRSDRQPEFTQLDIEMSCVEQKDIKILCEKLLKKILFNLKNIEIKDYFLNINYKDAIEKYGSDKPDLRFDLQIINLTQFNQNNNNLFGLNNNEIIKCLYIPKLITGKQLKMINTISLQNNISKILILKNGNDIFSGSAKSLLNTEQKLFLFTQYFNNINKNKQGTWIIIKNTYKWTHQALGAIRCYFGEELCLINYDEYKFVWINNWPLFEYDQYKKKYKPLHHPFTSPLDVNKKYSINELKTAISSAFDLVLNGNEIGGGSIRITNLNLQHQIFEILDLSKEQIDNNFSWFLNAFEYGAPPHGGIAFGIDRILMAINNDKNIKNFIAFPKNNQGVDLLTNSPSKISKTQITELSIIQKNKL